MSLLLIDKDAALRKLADEVFERQFADDPRLNDELDEWAKRAMYQDAAYNVNFLHTVMSLGDDGLYAAHARWVHQLLVPLLPNCTRERVRDIMAAHYELIRSCMEPTMPAEDRPRMHRILDGAVRAAFDECARETPPSDGFAAYREESELLLDRLLNADTISVSALVLEFASGGIPLPDLYVDIVAPVMRRVGELWHRNVISVDVEHRCTSTMQIALSQFYPFVFERERRGKTLLVACVGSELHELGARTVADLFEYSGWDSVFLGAATPIETIEAAIDEHDPILVALSVTMTHHLPLCKKVVERLRASRPNVAIAVGGRDFENTGAWKSWDVDECATDARVLVRWAEENLG